MSPSRTRGANISRVALRQGSCFALLLVLGAVSACHTTNNIVTMKALETRFPVSASSAYIDGDGATVTADDYAVARTFTFERTVEGARHEDTETALRLEGDLNRLVASTHGDAIVGLRVAATSYETGSQSAAAIAKDVGWCAVSAGSPLVLVGIPTAASGKEHSGELLAVGSGMVGVGLIAFLIGALARHPTVWHLQVSGAVIQRKPSIVEPQR